MDIQVDLNNHLFKPRPYQLPILNALELDGFKKILCIMARRSGKDLTAWNLMIREAIRKKGLYIYCLPLAVQCRTVIWDAIASDGTNFLSYIPQELIANVNNQEMKVRLHNGSIIKLAGSDSYNRSLVGSNVRMVVFSEWSLADERAWPYVKPILAENNGTVIFLSTPRSMNHLYDLFQMAKKNQEWWTYFTTVKDTKHISEEQIQKEIDSGEISWDLAQQEYYCSFQLGSVGAYYHEIINKLKLEGKVGFYPYDIALGPVITVWDLGLDNHCVVLFVQLSGSSVRIIECYDKIHGGLVDYIKYVLSRDYIYAGHYAPHDIDTREISTGVARMDIAESYGISFNIVPKLKVQEGIESVRCMLPRTLINQPMCKDLIRALETYHRTYDEARGRYDEHPYKDWSEHMADAMRYLAVIEPYCREGMTNDDIQQIMRRGLLKRKGPQTEVNPWNKNRLSDRTTITYL